MGINLSAVWKIQVLNYPTPFKCNKLLYMYIQLKVNCSLVFKDEKSYLLWLTLIKILSLILKIFIYLDLPFIISSEKVIFNINYIASMIKNGVKILITCAKAIYVKGNMKKCNSFIFLFDFNKLLQDNIHRV